MIIGNLHRPITSAWLTNEGHRLDAPPFLSGAVEARVLLAKLNAPKQPLRDVTAGYNGGIYNGPQFKRNYVSSPEHGVPFLGSSSMLQADLSDLPLISKKSANSPKLLPLHVEEGMTLISCSGTIGRTTYARPEMVGMLTSQHIMKVVPNPEVIPPGYLYAYLSSRFGKTLVTSGTYGAIIQHIEPEHIADLQVPRFGPEFEQKVHELVSEAGRLRTQATFSIQHCIHIYNSWLGEEMTPKALFSSVKSIRLQTRLDSTFHSSLRQNALSQVRNSQFGSVRVSELAKNVIEAPRLKRQGVEKDFGLPFFGTSTLFDSEPEPSYYLNTKSLGRADYTVSEKSLLVPRSGQVQGIIGNVVFPQGQIIGGLVSEHAIRIDFHDTADAGYVYVALASRSGVAQLKAMPFGSSIPTLNPDLVGSVEVIAAGQQGRRELGEQATQARNQRDQAIELENQARQLVEQAIEKNFVPPNP